MDLKEIDRGQTHGKEKDMNKRKKGIVLLCAFAAAFVALTVWIAWGNTALELNTYTITSERLPDAFDGFRIAHVSDLHNAEMGRDNEKLLTMLREAQPDMIAITGDMIDYQINIDVALRFIQNAVEIAPCYFVRGNHEFHAPMYMKLKEGMEAAGVIVLEDEGMELTLAGDSITLFGLNDPDAHAGSLSGDSQTVISIMMEYLRVKNDRFTILLSHRPEAFKVYVKNGVDLVLSGHAHGGQFRLPFVGGLYAPNQGVFPEYDAGLYTQGNTNMIVSRGIGNSGFPFRINNRPELIIIELRQT